jgi:Cof subfamily protein (haloacid dehalogenase superfamily)
MNGRFEMKYKLMAVDIDGTLLNSRGELTDNTVMAIREAIKKGLVFVISTGRPIEGVVDLINKINLDIPVITYNGAVVLKGSSKECLYNCNLSKEDTVAIYNMGKEFETMTCMWIDGSLYVSEVNEKTKKYAEITGASPFVIDDINDIAKDGATKVLWYDDVERIEGFIKDLDGKTSDSYTYHTSRPYFLEFVNSNATKAIAMEKLGEIYKIDRNEMIAVGDGYNDLSMIKYAGIGVAMGNSKEDIKNAADYVTLTNDEDGVAEVIRKFVLDELGL